MKLILTTNETQVDNIIPMAHMKPLQLGQIVHHPDYGGHYVMRTQSLNHVEVINLTNPLPACGWSGLKANEGPMVRILSPNEKITLEMSNGY